MDIVGALGKSGICYFAPKAIRYLSARPTDQEDSRSEFSRNLSRVLATLGDELGEKGRFFCAEVIGDNAWISVMALSLLGTKSSPFMRQTRSTFCHNMISICFLAWAARYGVTKILSKINANSELIERVNGRILKLTNVATLEQGAPILGLLSLVERSFAIFDNNRARNASFYLYGAAFTYVIRYNLMSIFFSVTQLLEKLIATKSNDFMTQIRRDFHSRVVIPLSTDSVLNRHICPITYAPILHLARDPLSGHVYERWAICEWLKKNQVSPMTREPLRVEDLVEMPEDQAQIDGRVGQIFRNTPGLIRARL